ncbi:hypothetical protein ABZS95_10335 [Streptomyces sp. NPDC005479]|uniref:hypothetical protein n=1 Tax=Streptomyces sp. NPDC005479 TaxID=3154879 RepID=UPI0033BA9AB7
MSDRIPLDDLTSDELDALYDRAEQAEATITRVRGTLAPHDWPHAQVRAAAVRTALDAQPTT